MSEIGTILVAIHFSLILKIHEPSIGERAEHFGAKI